MANKRRAPAFRNGKGKRRALLAEPVASFSDQPGILIPVRWVNSVIAVFLLPLLGIVTQTFFTCLSRETLAHGFWASEEFWFFSLGALLCVIAFFGLPRPVLVYVFGHELTHALWVWAMGGRVSAFKVNRDGGHIITDTHNFWIALAPYFFPLYSIVVIALYGLAGLFWDMHPYSRLLYALIGATWAFHVLFTIWMIPKGQTDLTYHGTFFSLVIICLMNLVVLSVLMITASQDLTFLAFGQELIHNAADFSGWISDRASFL